MTHVTCRLTAKNRDRLRNLPSRNPTLGNRVWATFTFLVVVVVVMTYFDEAVLRCARRQFAHLSAIVTPLPCISVSRWSVVCIFVAFRRVITQSTAAPYIITKGYKMSCDIYWSAPGMGAMRCDERVCLSVCGRVQTSPNSIKYTDIELVAWHS